MRAAAGPFGMEDGVQDHGTGHSIGSALAAERAGSARRRPRRLAVMAASASVTETVGSLTAGTTYQFQVQACNATGTGGATACGAWSAALEQATSSG